MKKIATRISILIFITSIFTACHEDETYYCYLVENNWFENDTIGSYDEAFWFYKRKQKPEDECKVAWAEKIIEHQYDPSYSCDCVCGWEPD